MLYVSLIQGLIGEGCSVGLSEWRWGIFVCGPGALEDGLNLMTEVHLHVSCLWTTAVETKGNTGGVTTERACSKCNWENKVTILSSSGALHLVFNSL